jgi:ribulose-phosphate 3-epimerase
MIEIAASVLAADFAKLGDELGQAFAAGISRVHVDVMDGLFVPNLSMGPEVLRAIRASADRAHATVTAHLMIVDPARYLEAFVKAGAHRIAVHVEGAPLLARTLERIRELGAHPTVVLNPATPLTMLEEVIELVECVLVMSVDPGFGGQAFRPSTLGKLARLRRMLDERGLQRVGIAVDGGITAENIAAIASAGANYAVCGTAVFDKRASIAENVRALQDAARAARPPG